MSSALALPSAAGAVDARAGQPRPELSLQRHPGPFSQPAAHYARYQHLRQGVRRAGRRARAQDRR
eukprot:3014092-Rhodomonas_salina.1